MLYIKETLEDGKVYVECNGVKVFERLTDYSGNKLCNVKASNTYRIAKERLAKLITNILLEKDNDKIDIIESKYGNVTLTCIDSEGKLNQRSFKLGHAKNRDKLCSIMKKYDYFRNKTQSEFLTICKDHGIVLI